MSKNRIKPRDKDCKSKLDKKLRNKRIRQETRFKKYFEGIPKGKLDNFIKF